MEPKDSVYYNGNCDYPPVTLEIESIGIKSSIELHWDCSGDDLVDAFYALLSTYFEKELILLWFKIFAAREDLRNAPKLGNDLTISLKSDDLVMTSELKWNNTISDLLRVFRSITIGMTFGEDVVYDMLRDFIEEKCPEEIEKEE